MGCDCGCEFCCDPIPPTKEEIAVEEKRLSDELGAKNFAKLALFHAKRMGHYPASTGYNPKVCVLCGLEWRETV
jgi:hypothetical protein